MQKKTSRFISRPGGVTKMALGRASDIRCFMCLGIPPAKSVSRSAWRFQKCEKRSLRAGGFDGAIAMRKPGFRLATRELSAPCKLGRPIVAEPAVFAGLPKSLFVFWCINDPGSYGGFEDFAPHQRTGRRDSTRMN